MYFNDTFIPNHNICHDTFYNFFNLSFISNFIHNYLLVNHVLFERTGFCSLGEQKCFLRKTGFQNIDNNNITK